MDIIKILIDPPEKVLLMYRAVSDMVREGADINGMKVSDITTRAGIGKGTAYEYFSSKEEIITGALTYDMKERLGELALIVGGADSFPQKMHQILDFVEEKFGDNQSFYTLVRIATGSYDVSETFKQEYRRIQEHFRDNEVDQLAGLLLAQGLREGVITERDPYLGRMAVSGSMLAYATYLVMKNQGSGFSITGEHAKEFVYEVLVKSLN